MHLPAASPIVIDHPGHRHEGRRGGKRVTLKANPDKAAALAPGLERMIVVRATGAAVAMTPGRDVWYHEAGTTSMRLPIGKGR